MEMKNTVRGIAPIVLILYLVIRDFFFFSSKISSSISQLDDHDDHHQSSSSSSSNNNSNFYGTLIYAKPSYLFIFFTFNTLLVAVILGIYSQLSKSSSSSTSSSSIELSISSIFIDSDDEGLTGEKDEDIQEYKYHDFIPGIVYDVDYEEEEKSQIVVESYNTSTEADLYGYGYGYGHQQEYKDDHDHNPGIVLVEYFKEEKMEGQRNSEEDDHGEKDDNQIQDKVKNNEKDEILIGDKDYDYDEETGSEEGSYSELDDVDFNKRIEEFIVENNKKWREELQNDMLLLGY